MSLTKLNIGHEGKVVHIDVDKNTKHRLNGLGIIIGSYIKTRSTGWGIKVYEVKGTQVALRNKDAAKIFIV